MAADEDRKSELCFGADGELGGGGSQSNKYIVILILGFQGPF